tara:strand:+ start:7479 stop:8156 length:678 start_codon:yes stop_codon:yes gene_type:complete
MNQRKENQNRALPRTDTIPPSPIPTEKNHLNLTKSTRFKISVFATIILTITGIAAYIYNPDNIDKFAFYTINMVLPIISYVIGRTVRSGRHNPGVLAQTGVRYKTALITFIGSLIIGVVCYIFSPENIDKLGMYMIGVVLPVVGVILGQSFRRSEKKMYEHDYDGYGDYYGDNNQGGNKGGNHGDEHGHHEDDGDCETGGGTESNYEGPDDFIEGDKGVDDYGES